MIELIFGLVFTAVPIIFSVFLLGGNTNNTFSESLGALAILAIFLIVGLYMLFLGIKKIFNNILTATKGIETYGIIAGVYPSGTYVNNQPLFKADILLVNEYGEVQKFTEDIGRTVYETGEFVAVKYFKNDVNIKEAVSSSYLPSETVKKLESSAGLGSYTPEIDPYIEFKYNERQERQRDVMREYQGNSDVVVIDGKTYKRID